MTAVTHESARARFQSFAEWPRYLPAACAAASFSLLFARPFETLVRDWWTLPDAGHGILLAPIAIGLAWKAGIHPAAARNVLFGATILIAAVLLRGASSLAAELFTMRLSMIGGLLGLTVYFGGVRQAVRWRLPFILLVLAIPLPQLITQAITLPLQFQASELGAYLLSARGVPVLLTGNVIRIPGHELFVTEACSGLRSLSALMSVAILAGAFFLRTAVARIGLLLVAVPIAIAINGVRVFLTGFLVHFASPSLGTGFMHATEGWLLFLISLSALAGAAAIAAVGERALIRKRPIG